MKANKGIESVEMTLDELHEERVASVKIALELINAGEDPRGKRLTRDEARAYIMYSQSKFSTIIKRSENPLPSHGKGKRAFYFTKEIDKWIEEVGK